jgi:heme exporter protein B
MWQQVRTLFLKEFRLELRNRYALNGILLYVVSTVFVCYLSFKQVVSAPVWNALFWVIMLFAALNAVGRSFVQEGRGRMLYYYSVIGPQAFVLAKMLYNALLMAVIGVLAYVIYAWWIGDMVQDHGMFVLALVLGSVGFAGILTLMSAIAAKTDNNLSLMAILSFPVQLPFLLTLIKLSKNAVDGLDPSVSYPLIGILALLLVIIVTLSLLLFPYLWRD